jgi:transcriptional regulator of acetoin/glycerol metabolism
LVLESLRTDEEFALHRGERSNQRLSHGDRVELNVNRENLLSEPEGIFGSWGRCLLDYRVDARNCSAPHIITQDELKVFREPLENTLIQAQEEIDRLYSVLRKHAYVVLLCDRQGVAIHHRGDEALATKKTFEQECSDSGCFVQDPLSSYR